MRAGARCRVTLPGEHFVTTCYRPAVEHGVIGQSHACAGEPSLIDNLTSIGHVKAAKTHGFQAAYEVGDILSSHEVLDAAYFCHDHLIIRCGHHGGGGTEAAELARGGDQVSLAGDDFQAFRRSAEDGG